jgi:hypothetical protein
MAKEFRIPKEAQQIGFFMDRMGVRGIFLVAKDSQTFDIVSAVGGRDFLSHGVLPLQGDLICAYDVRTLLKN